MAAPVSYVIEFEDPAERWSSVIEDQAELLEWLESATGDPRIARAVFAELAKDGSVEYRTDMVADDPQDFGIDPDEADEILGSLPDVEHLVIYVRAARAAPAPAPARAPHQPWGIPRQRNAGRPLFHGTSRTQLERILAAKRAQGLYLTDVEAKAWDYAERQAERDDAELALLVVDPRQLPGNMAVDPGASEAEHVHDMGQWVYEGPLPRSAIVAAYYVDDDTDEPRTLLPG